MAGSSETTSFADQSTSVVMLNVKPSQNLILDLTASCYNESLRSIIECLHFSPLDQALTMVESISLIHLSKAFSTLSYVLADDVINFEIDSKKSSINKARFCRMLGFGTSEGPVDPALISSFGLIHMFYQMGYNNDIFFSYTSSRIPTFLLCGMVFSPCCSRASLNVVSAPTTQVCSLLPSFTVCIMTSTWITVLFSGHNLFKAHLLPLILLKFPMLGFGPLSSKEPWFTLTFLLLVMLLLMRFRSYIFQHLCCPLQLSSISLEQFQRSCLQRCLRIML
ncbi:unnamed protein product [Lactuca saligna]|uniref:Uncharacterized protein n=1 Tax=Lactuca saligna TaxID=75948 RepID=A0AA35YJE9_LACSI|nr:unnamed protein product [Lactuca saligna]